MRVLGMTGTSLLLWGALGQVSAQDTIRVRADGPPRWGAGARLVEEFAIGRLDGPPEYAFGEIHAATAGGDGSVYVFDANDRQIRRYDAKGRFLNLVGTRGEGPGEYRYVAGMDVTRDGHLVIKDPENSRVSYFQGDGRLVRDFPVLRFGFYGENFVTDTAGLIYMVVAGGGAMAEGPGSRQQYLRLTSNGTVRDSITLPAQPVGLPRAFWLSTSDGMRWNFTPQLLTAFYPPGGFLTALSDHYRVTVVQPGRPVRVIERSFRAIPIAGGERADWERWIEYFRIRPAGAARTYELPHRKPAIRAVRGDHQGRIWVDVFVAAEKRNEPPRPAGDVRPVLTWKERTTYDLFSPTGEYLTRVTLPAQSILLAVRDNRLVTRGKGPDGEDRVIVYRLVVPGQR